MLAPSGRIRVKPVARRMFACWIATVALAGCGASGASLAPNTTPAARPAAGIKNKALLYVATDYGTTTVNIFTYPEGEFVGSLTSDMSFARVCSDPKTGHVFVSQNNGLDEYQRGETTKITTLAAPEGYTQLLGCSIDPLSGDVAAVAYESLGGLLVYPHGTGTPLVYSDPSVHAYYYCSYDDKGNIFILGYGVGTEYITSVFSELPKGGKAFRDITMPSVGYPQKLQWDGKHMALNEGATIYQMRVSGSTGDDCRHDGFARRYGARRWNRVDYRRHGTGAIRRRKRAPRRDLELAGRRRSNQNHGPRRWRKHDHQRHQPE
jgi:hypothetical protein